MDMGSDKVIGLGLAGAGTVGGGVVKAFREKEQFFRKDLGLPVKLARIVDADASRFAALPTGDAVCSGDLTDILGDQGIGIVIELIGGTTTAKDFILSALARGKHVVTANKALLALHGPEIFEAAERNEVSVYFEASVGGGMPVIKTIREALVGNDASSVKTIINGTCNYILTRMAATGLPFAEALREAQAKGYAEANPALDIGGGDSGHKVAIIASLLHSGYLPFSAVSVEGISGLTPEDIEYADELGYVIKLLGIVERKGPDAPIEARVHPAMLRREHILASVSDAFNAVLLHGNNVGDILLYGKGAGELPTASAVMSDIADVARNILGGTPRRLSMGYYREARRLPVKPLAEHVSRYYLRFSVVDRPGVLAAIATVFGKHSISISSVMQREAVEGQSVPVIFLTHEAVEAGLRAALAEIAVMDFNLAATQVIRIED
jgi:homoserine dehydrogenase